MFCKTFQKRYEMYLNTFRIGSQTHLNTIGMRGKIWLFLTSRF